MSDLATGSADVLTFRHDAVPAKVLVGTPQLNVLEAFCKILDRDLKVTGIPKRDNWVLTLNDHALRHNFGTMLSVAGVAPRIAQVPMRHSSIDLTMNCYVDPRLLDVQGAVESHPEMTVTSEPTTQRQRIAACAENFVAPTTDFSSLSQSTAVTFSAISSEMSETPETHKTPGKTKFSRSSVEYARRKSNPQPSDPKLAASSH